LAQADAAPGSLSDADPFTLSPGIWQLTASTVEGEQPYSEVLDAAGFRVIRHFWHLRRPVSGADAQAPATPPGASVRVVDPAADRALLARLRNESFAEHFGWHEMSVAEYWDVIESMPGRNPATRWIAELDGEPVGFVLLDDSRAERNRGWVRSIGVLREARGRGIARWLLRLANADALARGYDSIGLGVDSANVTGATALYESEGYVVDEAIDAWLLPLTAETP
jgi:ribosomal protein S18 acetylase RimI-like enzyme